MARALTEYCGRESLLSLAEGAELMQTSACRAAVDLPLYTYANAQEFVRRSLFVRNALRPIFKKLRDKPPDVAIVPMMGYWDIFMIRYLHDIGVPVVVVIHDAEVHPGDHFHLMVRLQRHLMRLSQGVVMLSDFIASKVQRRLSLAGKVTAIIPHVCFAFRDLDLPAPQPPETAPKRPLRLLLAGRLRRYKGITLLVDALKLLGGIPFTLRVVGSSINSSELSLLSALPGVELDLDWKKERDFISYFDWADACVLPYIEASQSGVVPISFQRERASNRDACGRNSGTSTTRSDRPSHRGRFCDCASRFDPTLCRTSKSGSSAGPKMPEFMRRAISAGECLRRVSQKFSEPCRVDI